MQIYEAEEILGLWRCKGNEDATTGSRLPKSHCFHDSPNYFIEFGVRKNMKIVQKICAKGLGSKHYPKMVPRYYSSYLVFLLILQRQLRGLAFS